MNRNIDSLFTLVTVFLISFLMTCSYGQANGSCSDDPIECLETQLIEKEYTKEYWEKLWEIYSLAEAESIKCDSIINTSRFLELSNLMSGAATTEAFHKTLELKLLPQTECFLNALLMLDPKKQKEILKRLLQPIYITDQKEIDKYFTSFKKEKKFKEIIEIYFDLRE